MASQTWQDVAMGGYLVEQLAVLQLLRLALKLIDGQAHVSRYGQIKAVAVPLHTVQASRYY